MYGKRMILVLQRGWVVVGEIHHHPEGSLFLSLTNGGDIRRWGTTKGLGELAKRGPLPSTAIDRHETEAIVPLFSVIKMHECNEEAWKQWFSQSK